MCIICHERGDFTGGACSQCAGQAIMHAKLRFDSRQFGNAYRCLFCEKVVDPQILSVHLFTVMCHWLCFIGWCVAMAREKMDRREARGHVDRVKP